jgi:hypothetical protein
VPTDTPSNDDPFESISNFFDSGLWSAASLLLQVFAVALWLALVYWAYQDARRRLTSQSLIVASGAVSFFIPFLGPIIYLVLRPPEYLEEARERQLEVAELERRVSELGERRSREEIDGLLAGGQDAADVGLKSALKRVGALTEEDLANLDLRLSELEFRVRSLDRSLDSPSARASRRERVDIDRLEAIRAERREKLGLPPLEPPGSVEREPDDGPSLYDHTAPPEPRERRPTSDGSEGAPGEPGETGRAVRPRPRRTQRLPDPENP